jgi:hypothetical protein
MCRLYEEIPTPLTIFPEDTDNYNLDEAEESLFEVYEREVNPTGVTTRMFRYQLVSIPPAVLDYSNSSQQSAARMCYMEMNPGTFVDPAFTLRKDNDDREYYYNLEASSFCIKPPKELLPRGGIL